MRNSFLAGVILFAAGMLAAEVALTPWGSFFSQGNPKTKAIALTFDDGPHPSTLKVLELLEKSGVKVTFFMLGSQVKAHPEIAKAVALSGHELGNHTYRHVGYHNYKGDGPAKLGQEIEETEQAVFQATGLRPRLLRMPHGFMRSWVKDVAKEKQLVIVHWTFGRDWFKVPRDELIRDYIAHTTPGAVLLFHDGAGARETTLACVQAVIDHAQKQGYRIVPAGELLNLQFQE